MKITRSEQRRHHADGSFSDYVTFRFPAESLRFVDIDHSDQMVKLQDVAHYRYVKALDQGVENPTTVAFARLAEDRPVAQLFPDLSAYVTEDGEHLLSANSFITYTMRHLFHHGWIRFVDGTWETAVPGDNLLWQQRGTAVLNYLSAHNSIYTQTTPGIIPNLTTSPIDINRDLIAVAGCAFLADFAHRERPELIFNSSFFLLEDDDTIHHHSALGEAYGFWMAGGVIHRPPLFRRGAIFQGQNGAWQVDFLGLDDLSLTLPTGLIVVPQRRPLAATALPYSLNEPGASAVTLFNRTYGVAQAGRVLGYTPAESGCFELTVIDQRVVGWKDGGGLALPHNGFVISFAPGAVPSPARRDLLDALRQQLLLSYQFVSPQQQTIRQGLQTGPILLNNGRSPLTNTYLQAGEQFWPTRALANGDWQFGVVPTRYKTDVDMTRAGRMGIGIDRQGDLLVVMAPGVNEGRGLPGVDSFGATLLELANLLREAGAVSALNFDGGGSTQAYFRNVQTIVPADRRDPTPRPYERMVPSAGICHSG